MRRLLFVVAAIALCAPLAGADGTADRWTATHPASDGKAAVCHTFALPQDDNAKLCRLYCDYVEKNEAGAPCKCVAGAACVD